MLLSVELAMFSVEPRTVVLYIYNLFESAKLGTNEITGDSRVVLTTTVLLNAMCACVLRVIWRMRSKQCPPIPLHAFERCRKEEVGFFFWLLYNWTFITFGELSFRFRDFISSFSFIFASLWTHFGLELQQNKNGGR